MLIFSSLDLAYQIAIRGTESDSKSSSEIKVMCVPYRASCHSLRNAPERKSEQCEREELGGRGGYPSEASQTNNTPSPGFALESSSLAILSARSVIDKKYEKIELCEESNDTQYTGQCLIPISAKCNNTGDEKSNNVFNAK